MGWNFNMDEAPRGSFRTVTRKVGKNEITADQFFPDQIIVADASGTVVTLSHWKPNEGRWQMFTAEHPPIAWQFWPDHPRPA